MRHVPRFELVEWVVANEGSAKYKLGSSNVYGDQDTLAMIDWEPVVDEVNRHHGYAFESHREVAQRLAGIHGLPQGEALLTQGTSEANALVMHLLCSEGTEVIVDVPAYQPLPALPGLFGSRTVPVPRHMAEEWRLDLQRVQEAVTSKTAAIFTSNPHNPTGATLMREDLRALADIAADAKAQLVVDEIFRPFVEDDNLVPPVRQVAPEAISTGSVSKVYAWASSRLGWISAPSEIIQEAKRKKNEAIMRKRQIEVDRLLGRDTIAGKRATLERMEDKVISFSAEVEVMEEFSGDKLAARLREEELETELAKLKDRINSEKL